MIILEKGKVSFFLASRSIIRGNKGITTFTILVMTLIFLQIVLFSSILGGVTVQFNKLMVDYQTGNLVIEPVENEKYIEDTSSLQKKIEGLPEIIGSSARLRSSGVISHQGKEVGTVIYGIDPGDESQVTHLESAMLSGEFISRPDRGEIILGREVSGGYGALMESKSLGGVEVGDTVNVKIEGVNREFRVKGIYSTLYSNTDSSAYINKADMEEILGVKNRANEIVVKTTSDISEEDARMKLLSLGIKEEIRTWHEFAGMLKTIESTLTMLRNAFSAIGLLIAFVIIFVVIYVNIVNKKRQIGVQKAIGIDQKVIVTSFVIQAMLYAFIGITLGYLIMHYIISPYTIVHPLQIAVGPISLILENFEAFSRAALLFLAAVIGSFIPAYNLSKKSLLELIWGK
jgi:putative ABC transport system permease protein